MYVCGSDSTESEGVTGVGRERGGEGLKRTFLFRIFFIVTKNYKTLTFFRNKSFYKNFHENHEIAL
jgi:hypothetical protein